MREVARHTRKKEVRLVYLQLQVFFVSSNELYIYECKDDRMHTSKYMHELCGINFPGMGINCRCKNAKCP